MSKFGGGGIKCTSCDKTSYPAETIVFEQLPFHVQCFRCQEEGCGKKIANSAGAQLYKTENDGVEEKKVFCKMCFSKGGYAQKQKNVKWVKKEGGTSNTGSLASKFGGGGVSCKVCSKTVYSAEQINFEKNPYHPQCFCCSTCERKLTPSGASQYEDKIYCANCFKAGGFTAKQARQHSASTSSKANSIASKFGGGGNPCSICSKTVYMAETINYEKKIYHQKCFACTTCQNKISPANASQFEDKIYCKKCFAEGGFTQKQARAGSRTSVASKSVDSRFAKFGGGGLKCKICEKTVYQAENVPYEGCNYHQNCFKCKGCDIKLKIAGAEFNKQTETLWCRKCFKEQKFE